MKIMPQNPYENEKIDLQKHGLSSIQNRSMLSLTKEETERFLDAMASEDFSVRVPIPPIPHIIDLLLSQANCRKCGRCCLPNPLNPTYSIVEVFEDELKPIERHYHYSHRHLKRITFKGKLLQNPYKSDVKAMTRWFPLPCPFFDNRIKICKIYEFRPRVCKVYPVLLRKGETRIEINVNCDYGKDIFKSAIEYLRQNKGNVHLGQV